MIKKNAEMVKINSNFMMLNIHNISENKGKTERNQYQNIKSASILPFKENVQFEVEGEMKYSALKNNMI